MKLIEKIFPFLIWQKGYTASSFKSDLLAGITVAVILIPQSMAYAMLAGLPPVYGLYAATFTPMIGALWGSLKQLATGPIAILSLLVLTTLTPYAEPGSERYIEMAILMSLMIGGIYLFIGLFRLGIIMAFISHAAVTGFTSAAALIITATQLPHLMGITTPHREFIFPMFLDIIRGIPDVHLPTLGIGLLSFAIIYMMKKYRPSYPAGLLAILLTTTLLLITELGKSGIAVVGQCPAGLPLPGIPVIDFKIISSIIGATIVVALVSFAETYSVSKSISAETRQKVDVNQEFIGQGLANLIGSLFQGYPVSGSFSRSAVNFATGAKSGVSNIISGFIVILTLLFLTPLFTHIPRTTLAALVISAVLLLFNPRKVFSLWKMNKHDGVVGLSVFFLSLVAKPDYALIIGVLVSLVLYLWKTMHPRIVSLTKDTEHNMFINADVYHKPLCPQILHLRFDNSIYFANAEFVQDFILKHLDDLQTPVKYLVLDFKGVGFIDITAIETLTMLHEELQTRNIDLLFTGIHLPVKEVFSSSGFMDRIDVESLFDERYELYKYILDQLDHAYCKNVCPHTLFDECDSLK